MRHRLSNVLRANTKKGWMPFLPFCLFLLSVHDQAHATSYTYELEGTISASWIAITPGIPAPRRYPMTFDLTINRGDLILQYDNRNTASLADDFVTLRGTTHGCFYYNHAGCTPVLGGAPFGLDDYGWDLELFNPIVDPNLSFGTTGFDNFAFGMQNAGQITRQNPIVYYGASTPVDVKNSADGFAFRLTADGDPSNNRYRILSWLQLTGGFLPTNLRLESDPTEAVFNSDLVVYLATPPPSSPPSTEIPEPSSILLLLGAIGYMLKAPSKEQ